MALINRPGEAQIDFFEVVVEVGGERRKAWEFLMRLTYSGREFAWLTSAAIRWRFSTAPCEHLHICKAWHADASTIVSRPQCARS